MDRTRLNVKFCLTFLTCAVAAVVCGIGQGKPSIQFDNTSRDAGTVQQGDIIRQVFRFANKGAGTLEILSVEHS